MTRKIKSNTYKNNRCKVYIDKHQVCFPEMEDRLDEWATNLREVGCCIDFKVKKKKISASAKTKKNLNFG